MLFKSKSSKRRAKSISTSTPENLEPRMLLTAGIADDCCTTEAANGFDSGQADSVQATAIGDRAGSSRRTALNLGTIDDQESVRGYVGRTERISRDTSDYFRFEIDSRSDVSVDLSRMTGDLNLYLADAAGRSVLSSRNFGVRKERVSTSLAAGSHYAVAAISRSSSSFYTLSIDVQADLPTQFPTPPQANPNPDPPSGSLIDPAPGSFNTVTGCGQVNANAAVSAALGNQTLLVEQPAYGGRNDWNVNQVHAHEVWYEGYTGEGSQCERVGLGGAV